MSTHVDLIIIGSGSAAQGAAFPYRQAGKSVLVIDSRPFGGTCELRGCEPKKILANAAELVDWSRRMQGKGISSPAHSLSWHELIQFKRSFTQPVPASIEQSLIDSGIQYRHGRAHFVDAQTLQLANETFTAQHILIAGGARHATLGIPGEEYLTTSTQFLELDVLPPRIIFVGGGYIAFEFAHVSARTGAQVHILHRGPRPLNKFEPELVDSLVAATTELGITVRTNTPVVSIERDTQGLIVHIQTEAGLERLEADMVVHAAGRVPEIDDLQLEAAGVAYTSEGVTVNEYLQSASNPAVYAAGDVVNSGQWPLTPIASLQGSIVAKNLLEGNYTTPNYTAIPSVVFTTPPLARAGLSEEEAREQGYDFVANYQDTSQWYSSRRLALKHSGFKVLVEKQSDRLLGAHLLGSHAEEVINIFVLAIRTGRTAKEVRETIYTFPTASSDIPYMLDF